MTGVLTCAGWYWVGYSNAVINPGKGSMGSIAINLDKVAAMRGFVAIDLGKGIIIMGRDLEGCMGALPRSTKGIGTRRLYLGCEESRGVSTVALK